MSGRALEGKNAVVTGSSRRIGRAIALAFAEAGARVVVNGRDSDPVEEVAARIRELGGRALALPGSVSDFGFAGSLIERCIGELGSIDALVNCAGIAEPALSSILDIGADDWRDLLGTHLDGSFNTCRHAAPRMAEQRSGSIVNTSSHAFLGLFGGTGYPAAKGATVSLSFALATDLAEYGVRVNAVCPGARTRISSGPDYEARIAGLHARGALDDAMRDAALEPPPPEQVAPFYVYLASDRSKHVTGQLFSASGGYVGRFRSGREDLLAFRSADQPGSWDVEELAAELGDLGSPR